MKALGEFLRKAREAKGLSLQDVQEVTKIRLFFLEAIENGNFDALPGQAYVKGFLRNYAAAVGVAEEEVMGRYNQLCQEQKNAETPSSEVAATAPANGKIIKAKEPKMPKEPKAPKAPKPAAASKKKNKIIIPVAIIGLGVIAGVIIGGLIIHPNHKSAKPVTANTAQPKPANPTKHDEKVTKPSSEFADVVRLEATDTVWIRLTERDTGKYIEEATLKKGDTRQWKLDRALTLLNGNAGGLKISDKGEPFQCHGNVGEVVTLTFTPPGE